MLVYIVAIILAYAVIGILITAAQRREGAAHPGQRRRYTSRYTYTWESEE